MLNIIATLLAFSATALAGPSITGGGKGVVCRNPDHSVRSVELLDLWEAENIYGRQILRSDAPVKDQVNAALARMPYLDVGSFDDADFQKLVYESGAEILQSQVDKFLDQPAGGVTYHHLHGATLALSEDSFESAWPSDCGVEQVVLFKMQEGAFFINDDLYNLMPKTDQAALVLHEAYYSTIQLPNMVNASQTPNSIHSRRLVGYVFAGGKFDQLPDASTPHISCEANFGDASLDVVSFTKDAATGQPQASIIGGFDGEQLAGYFLGKYKSYSWAGDKFDELLSDKECDGQPENTFFYVAGVGVGGPVDFDRYATIVGKCTAGKFTPYWTLTHDLKAPDSEYKELTCTKHNL